MKPIHKPISFYSPEQYKLTKELLRRFKRNHLYQSLNLQSNEIEYREYDTVWFGICHLPHNDCYIRYYIRNNLKSQYHKTNPDTFDKSLQYAISYFTKTKIQHFYFI